MSMSTHDHGHEGLRERAYELEVDPSTIGDEVVELVGLYWHFVDIVWIVIFTLVYLIPA